MNQGNKYIAIIFSTAILLLLSSCVDDPFKESFYPDEKLSIADYLEEQKDTLSTFYRLMDELNYLGTLSAYNPNGEGYTVFLPSDEAFTKFFQNSPDYSSIDDLISDQVYAKTLSLYHIVNVGLLTNDFPFGSLPDTTASGDYLTVAIDTASSLPRINGLASISDPNIELINGYIHIINDVLLPITNSLGEWLLSQSEFSILQEAFQLTGLIDELNSGNQYTLLLEPDKVLNESGIYDISDMMERYSPGSSDYTNKENGLYRMLAFHMIEGIFYLDDFEGDKALYNTSTVYPVSIDGEDLVMKINLGVGSLDTIVIGQDTTVINYVGFDYENSNNQAINGAVHQIDHVMDLFQASRVQVVNQFYNEPEINALRNDPGETSIIDQDDFQVLHWEGPEELIYVKSSEGIQGVWNNDYIILEGAFTMSYEIPRLLPGKYSLYIGAHAFDDNNASIQISFDGIELGGNIDLSSGGTSANPYFNFLVGTVELGSYESHFIRVNSLIPGKFVCDRFTLEPIE